MIKGGGNAACLDGPLLDSATNRLSNVTEGCCLADCGIYCTVQHCRRVKDAGSAELLLTERDWAAFEIA